MNAKEKSILDSGQRVGLAVLDFKNELADFLPLGKANDDRAALVKTIEDKGEHQAATTADTTVAKDAAREAMAGATATLSARAVGYALAAGRLDLKLAFALSYADVRYGEADEDVAHVRELVARVRALPEQVRKDYRLTDAIIDAPAAAADLFEKADDTQTTGKADPHLATLALPELLRRLSAVLLLMGTLIEGQRQDTDPAFRWADLHAAFGVANKRRVVAAPRRAPDKRPRIVRTLPFTSAGGPPQRLANTNYGPAYTLTVENHAASDLHLWMAQKDGAPTTPHTCPAGATTTVTRAALGPATARYLMAQFGGGAGGQATVVVRRVVA